jgi:hypothetical protein
MESLQAEMDQAQAALNCAVAEAVMAGAALESIGAAANLTSRELGRRIGRSGTPVPALLAE